MIALTVGACATFDVAVIEREQIVRSFVDEPAPRDVRVVVAASLDEGGIAVSVSREATCDRQRVDTVRRYEHTRRTARGPMIGIEYGGAALALLGGAVFIAIAGDYPDAPPPGDPSAFTRSKSIGVGIALLAIGAIAGGAAIADSLDARDTTRFVGETEVRPPEHHESEPCDRAPLATGVALIDTSAGRRAEVGATDAGGTLHVAWGAVPENWVRGSAPVAEVRIEADGVASEVVSIAAARADWAERAWQAATAAGTAEALAAFRAGYAEHRADEAEQAWRTARVAELRAEIDAALDAADGPRAKRIVDELTVLLGATAEVTAYHERVNALVRADLEAAIRAAVAAPFESATVAEDARTAADELEALGGRARTVKQLRAAIERRASKLAASLIARAKKAARAGDREQAQRLLDEAERATPGSQTVAKARAGIGE